MDNNLKQDHHKVKPASAGSSKVPPLEEFREASYKAGRGAQFNTKNRFLKDEKTK